MLCVEAGQNITLHSADIDIQNDTVIVQKKNGNNLGIQRYTNCGTKWPFFSRHCYIILYTSLSF